MLRRALLAAAVVAALACNKAPAKKGSVVAYGNGVVITADELQARLNEQSPMIRNSFQTTERKKQFLDNLVRFEVLAAAAEKEGLAKDPDVQFTMKKVMVSKWYQKHFQGDPDGAKNMPEPELRKYYDEHQADEFSRPERVHAAHVFLKADEGSPDRAKKVAEAKKLLARIQADEKKNPAALSVVAREVSEDAASKGIGGDLQFQTRDELERAWGKPFADTVFKGADNQTVPAVIETARGVHLVRVLGRQPEMKRSFEEAKTQIAAKLYGQKRTKDFEEQVKKLQDDARVRIDEKELEKISFAAPGGPRPPGMGGMGGHPGMGGAMPAPSAAAPTAKPATPAAGQAPAPAAAPIPAAPAQPAGH